VGLVSTRLDRSKCVFRVKK